MNGGGQVEPTRLELYLDGLLKGKDLQAFEEELRLNADLRAQVEIQDRIDSSLRRLFQAPASAPVIAAPRAPVRLLPSPAAAGRMVLHFVRTQWISIAAVLAIAHGVYRVYEFFYEPIPNTSYATNAWRSLESIYYAHVHDDVVRPLPLPDDLSPAFQARLGHGLKMRPLGPEVTVKGLSYFSPIARTVQLWVQAEGQDIMLFAYPREEDDPPAFAYDSELQVFRREIGDVVLYEVSPKRVTRSYLLDRFYEPDEAGSRPQ